MGKMMSASAKKKRGRIKVFFLEWNEYGESRE